MHPTATTTTTATTTAVAANDRVILLLDLDCFYAACECVRLGLDARTTPLALLQWNSVLAVTYPARKKYGIKRGDSWEAVRKKSLTTTTTTTSSSVINSNSSNSSIGESQENQGESKVEATVVNASAHEQNQGACYAVHVPILTTDPETTTSTLETSSSSQQISEEPTGSANNSNNNNMKSVLQDDYETIFQLSPEQQLQARKRDLGVRRFSSEGKACIERYRVASARIFTTVLEWIQESGLSNDVILERASIDEFFLDVTAACHRACDQTVVNGKITLSDAVKETVVIGSSEQQQQLLNRPQDDDDDDSNFLKLKLQRGCWIARSIRQAIFDKLGFTLSSGISINKTLAKLSSGYGKPNGQAVTFPHAVEYLLQETPICKCRNLGGKLGAKVQALLPHNLPPNVGSIAKNLSLPALRQGLRSDETAQWVFDVARGIDREPVVAKNDSAVTKSITAFKSLPFRTEGYSFEDASTWIRLLAREVVTRVEKDMTRNRRYPRSCTIQYSYRGQQNKSVRTNFPSEHCSTDEKIDQLAGMVPGMVQAKEGKNFRFNRIGMCATEFASRETGHQSIDRFFTAGKTEKTNAVSAATAPTTAAELKGAALQPQRVQQKVPRPSTVQEDLEHVNDSKDTDLELAKKLQADFDRENRLFQALDRRGTSSVPRPPKTRKIDSFFKKRDS